MSMFKMSMFGTRRALVFAFALTAIALSGCGDDDDDDDGVPVGTQVSASNNAADTTAGGPNIHNITQVALTNTTTSVVTNYTVTIQPGSASALNPAPTPGTYTAQATYDDATNEVIQTPPDPITINSGDVVLIDFQR
jgi:hypothetical protein